MRFLKGSPQFIAAAFSLILLASFFPIQGSDPQAIALAEQVMEKLGGRKNWQATRYICWNFFGRRFHVWDKRDGRYRMQSDKLVVLMNLNEKTGRAWESGSEITEPQKLAETLERAWQIWINDSYWLIMPYKLQDPGVTLKYRGKGKMQDGTPAEILELTFSGVGVTPENKYLVYVDSATGLVKQWDFFRKATDTEPAISTPWAGWKKYGKIMLSGDRGRRQLTDIAVFENLPDAFFTDPAPIDPAALKARAER